MAVIKSILLWPNASRAVSCHRALKKAKPPCGLPRSERVVSVVLSVFVVLSALVRSPWEDLGHRPPKVGLTRGDHYVTGIESSVRISRGNVPDSSRVTLHR
jgi:hypothetical protein